MCDACLVPHSDLAFGASFTLSPSPLGLTGFVLMSDSGQLSSPVTAHSSPLPEPSWDHPSAILCFVPLCALLGQWERSSGPWRTFSGEEFQIQLVPHFCAPVYKSRTT